MDPKSADPLLGPMLQMDLERPRLAADRRLSHESKPAWRSAGLCRSVVSFLIQTHPCKTATLLMGAGISLYGEERRNVCLWGHRWIRRIWKSSILPEHSMLLGRKAQIGKRLPGS